MMNLTLLELAAIAVALDGEEGAERKKEKVGCAPSMVQERNRRGICYSLQITD